MAVQPIATSRTKYRAGPPQPHPESIGVSPSGDARLWQVTDGVRTTPAKDLASEESDRLMRLTSKLIQLTHLQRNWDTYGAEPPSEKSLRGALMTMFSTWEMSLPEDVLPSVEGGVTLVYASDARGHAEIEFDNDGEIIAAFKRRGKPAEIWIVREDPSAAVRKLRRLLNHGV